MMDLEIDPSEPGIYPEPPILPLTLAAHIAASHGDGKFKRADHLPTYIGDQPSQTYMDRQALTAVWTHHRMVLHAKRPEGDERGPDHNHEGDEWWAFGRGPKRGAEDG